MGELRQMLSHRLHYRIIEGPTRAKRDEKPFHSQVEEMLSDGWGLCGGVAYDAHHHRLFQAVIKRELYDDEHIEEVV